ncbi:unnamed protein product, partial [Prorocentrum cordatum]
MARGLATLLVAICAAGSASAGKPSRSPRGSRRVASAPPRGAPRGLRSVPFSLRDAGGRDLVAEAASLRQSGGGRRLMAELDPAAPLQMSFTANDVKFNLELERARSVFTSGARIINGKGETVPGHRVTSTPIFRSEKHGAVLSPVSGRLRGLVRLNGSLVEVEADPATGMLSTSTQVHTSARVTGYSEGLMASSPTTRTFDPEAIQRWTNCYTDDHITHALSMGVSLGDSGAALFSDAEDATEWMQSVFAMANMVYTPQLNIVLMIDAVYIPSMVGETQSWASCGSSITAQLTNLEQWSQPSRQGLWHVFDDCHTAGVAGTVGLAVLGQTQYYGVCAMDPEWDDTMSNVGITYISPETWLTFAHEVGHNAS